jgi:hypothetical protein
MKKGELQCLTRTEVQLNMELADEYSESEAVVNDDE